MSDTNPDEFQDMDDVLSAFLTRHEKSRMTRFVVLMEVVDEDGTYGLWQMASRNSMAWHTKGMLQQAIDYEAAKTTGHMVVDIGRRSEE